MVTKSIGKIGQIRQRCGGNLYIDLVDVYTAAKALHLRKLLKYEVIPQSEMWVSSCELCGSEANLCDLEISDELFVKDTENLLELDVTSGFIAHKFDLPDMDDSEDITWVFLDEINRGR